MASLMPSEKNQVTDVSQASADKPVDSDPYMGPSKVSMLRERSAAEAVMPSEKKQVAELKPVKKTATVPQASADKPVDIDSYTKASEVWDLLKKEPDDAAEETSGDYEPDKAANESSADKPVDTASGTNLDGISHVDIKEDNEVQQLLITPTPKSDQFFQKCSVAIQ